MLLTWFCDPQASADAMLAGARAVHPLQLMPRSDRAEQVGHIHPVFFGRPAGTVAGAATPRRCKVRSGMVARSCPMGVQ